MLSKGAKRLLGAMLALGSVFLAGTIVVVAIAGAVSSRDARRLDEDYAPLHTAEQAYANRVQGCAVSGASTDCVHAADRELASAARAFAAKLGGERFPTTAVDDVRSLRDDALRMASILDQKAATSDTAVAQDLASQYQDLAQQIDDEETTVHDEMLF